METTGTVEAISAVKQALGEAGCDFVCYHPEGSTEWHLKIDPMAADRKAIDKILKDAKLEVAESSPMIAVDNSEELLKLQAELRQSKERESELESQIAEAKEPTADAKPKKEKATKKK